MQTGHRVVRYMEPGVNTVNWIMETDNTNSILDHGYRSQYSGPWRQDHGDRSQYSGLYRQVTVFWIMETGYSILDHGDRSQYSGSWRQVRVFCVMETGHSILGHGEK
jgi:hypothetical protein